MAQRSIASLIALLAGSASVAFASGRTSDQISQALTMQAGDQALLSVSENAPATYAHVPGVTEFQGKMIIRPITREDWLARGESVASAEDHISRARARLMPIQWDFVEIHNHVLVTLPAGVTENQMAAFLMATGEYQYAEPDYIVFPCVVPNDAGYTNAGMYAHQNCYSEPAWNLSTGSTSVIVGVTDTGVRVDHQDLQPNLVSGANSATGTAVAQTSGGMVNDLNGHGSHTAGTVGARGNNSVGAVGMGWINKVMPVRVSDLSSGNSSLAALQAGATWAAQNGARVVSTSYSGGPSAANNTVGATMRTSYNALWFWAAGNSNSSTNLTGNSWTELQFVSSVDSSDTKSSFSNFGNEIDIAAPGSSIYSTWLTSTSSYNTISGTSMACPAAAGAAGLIVAINPALTAIQVRDILYRNVDDIGAAGEDTLYGPGRLNLGKAAADAYRMSYPTTLPFSDNFDTGSFANAKWAYRDTLVTVSTAALAEPSGTMSADVASARRLESNAINLSGNSSALNLTFATETRGTEAGETMVVEYLNSSNAWVNLATYTSTGANENTFTNRNIVIPTGAAVRHVKFAIRFRATSATLDSTDHWYVDNVNIGGVPCDADFNGDNTVDFFDYLDFVDAFSAGLASADFNGDTAIDFFDYLDFVDAYSLGC